MDQFVEFENVRTGRTRRFPMSLFDCLTQLCLEALPAADRESVRDQIGKMVAEYLDRESAEPLRMAADAMFPKMGEIRFNTYSPEIIKIKCQRWANAIFARYGHPVYLVGSSLGGAGRDVDVRVILPNDEFEARFPKREGLDWEVGKLTRDAALFCHLNIDFQIQTFSETLEHDGKRILRLDDVQVPGVEVQDPGMAAP